MKYCIGNRGSGVTTKAIEYCYNNGYCMITASNSSKIRIKEQSKNLGKPIEVISINELEDKTRGTDKKFVIDNGLHIIKTLTGANIVGYFDSVENADVENIFRDYRI